MKKLLLASTLVLAGLVPAGADSLDPLHGMVCGPGGTSCTNPDNGLITPIQLGGGTTFAFASSPSGAVGDLHIVVLVPDNQIGGLVLPNITGTGLPGANPFSVAGGGADWTAGLSLDLAKFIFGAGVSSSPANPFSAYGDQSVKVDPGLTGFFAFQADAGLFGGTGLLGTSATDFSLTDFYSLSGGGLANFLPAGSVITAFMVQSDGSVISTAPSGQLEVQPLVSVPGPIVGAGLPGLVAALGGMIGLNRFRRKRRVA